jgi:DNA invertase Pin-like site-specific DNA recombinase
MRTLLEEAKRGKFDYLIAEALDRLSRDQEDIAAIYKRLRHFDIHLLTLAEGEISELHVGLKGTMNALFLKDLALKIRRGQRGRVEAGRIPGGSSYGYRIIRQLRADGSISTGEREIDPSRAAIIQRIFKEYADGMAPRQIAARLNREAVPSPRGGQWNASTINGNRRRRIGILNNELYLGRIIYNRQRFLKDPETGKRVARPNPEHEWITKEVPKLRIIEDDLWERVQALKRRYSSRWGNKRQSKKRLFSGLLKCGCCGGGRTISRGDRYYCSARREKSTAMLIAGSGQPNSNSAS